MGSYGRFRGEWVKQIQALLWLFKKGRDKKVPSLLNIASHPSNPPCIFQDGSTNARTPEKKAKNHVMLT